MTAKLEDVVKIKVGRPYKYRERMKRFHLFITPAMHLAILQACRRRSGVVTVGDFIREAIEAKLAADRPIPKG